MAFEEISRAHGGEDFVEMFPQHMTSVHADHSFGVAVEEDELEVADLAGYVVDAVIEDDGVCAGLCGGDQAKFVVARARCVANDEGETAYGDREAGDEDGRRDGACSCEEPDDPGVVVGDGSS